MNKKLNNYFSIKAWPWWDKLLVIFIIAFSLVVTFVPNGIPFGGPFLLISIYGLWCSKSSKAKDHEVDEYIDTLINNYHIEIDSFTTATFDLSCGYVVLGKDYKWRSSYYVIIKFNFEDDRCEISSYILNIMNSEIEEMHYTLAKSEKCYIKEENIYKCGVTKKIFYLISDSLEDKKLIVDLNDAQCSKIVNRLLHNEKV